MQYRPLNSRVVGGAALTLALGLAQAALAVPAFAAAPLPPLAAGDNGVLKVHELGALAADNATDPKVCMFTIEASKFDAGQQVLTFEILRGNPFVGPPVKAGTITLTAGTGAGSSTLIDGVSLGDGHYRVQLLSADNKGNDTFKVFTISCPPPVVPPVVPPAGPPAGPPVGPPAPPVVGPPAGPPVGPPAPPVVGPPVVKPPTVTPPVVTPPVVKPPTATPPVVKPPTVKPPTVKPPGGITGGSGTLTMGPITPVSAPVTVTPVSAPVSAPVATGTVTAAGAALPFTGDRTGALALWAFGAIGAGSVLLVGGRRRDGKHSA
jgi:hypothetical protein